MDKQQTAPASADDDAQAHALKLADDCIIIPTIRVRNFVVNCMTKVGYSPSHAEQLADALVCADYRGIFSHGLNRIQIYIDDFQEGTCKADGTPAVVTERASVARVDGKSLLGPVVGNFCMQLAIDKAKQTGIGMVAASHSNHFGIAGWYTLQALKAGMIGMSFTNSSPFCAPTRGRTAMTGTNPISMMAPGMNGDSFQLDMATTTVAMGKLEVAERKGQAQVPTSWGVDAEGAPCTDPHTIINDGSLLPLGGLEETGGYKGYGLNVMVEILCGVLGDANFGIDVRQWDAHNNVEANLGHCFVAIDVAAFGSGFAERLQSLLDMLRSAPAASGQKKSVLVAGDPEREHMKLVDGVGGIPYHPNIIKFANDVARKLNIEQLVL